MLEELGLAYAVHTVNFHENEQFAPEFLAISPNNKIPAIVDQDGPGGAPISVFESGAILIYLAEKTGSALLPTDPRDRTATMQWLMFQMGGVGPFLGQAHHFRRFAPEKIAYAINRYTTEAARLYGVMNKRLGEAEWLAGNFYSIADIATYPWTMRYDWQGIDMADYPNVKRWWDVMAARPAVEKGMLVPDNR